MWRLRRHAPTWCWLAPLVAACLVAIIVPGCAGARPQPPAKPIAPSPPYPALDSARLSRIRDVVQDAIRRQQLPGAVVVVGDRHQSVFREAFGDRALVPEREPMTPDTLFDLASLTKVVATTPAVMRLVERGSLALDDSVIRYVPEIDRYGKGRMTVRHLLTHTSGLRPGFDLAIPFDGRDAAIRLLAEEVPDAAPGERVIYSDLNFVLLGEIVSRAANEPFDRFVQREVFLPLGMKETTFTPPPTLVPRIAPTEACDANAGPCPNGPGSVLRGIVHDPTARRMGGVSGNAGLFSTADDLARFCRMLLDDGALNGRRVLSPLSVRLMTDGSAAGPALEVRGLGWDIDSHLSSVRGDLLPLGSFGHSGWTGSSLWIDRVTQTYVILLSNRVHPRGTGDVRELRERLANIVGGAVVGPLPGGLRQTSQIPNPPIVRRTMDRRPPPVLTGIDVLVAEQFVALKGRRVALLTNHTGVTQSGESTIDALRGAPGVTLVALLSPEHGIRGSADDRVSSTRDERSGLPVHSLYGDTSRPTDEMLEGIDTIVIDLQDIGSRFYTYMTTVGYVLEEAAKRGLRVVVLDRPNPVNGYQIEGPVQDDAARGFTAYFPMPVRHGLTLGELTRLFNGENKIGADLTVVPMRNWGRDLWFDETGLAWVNPSPNMRNMHQALLYPGIGALEWSNISVGRGTDSPFEQIGAPWIQAPRLARFLNDRRLAGVRFYPVTFRPAASVYSGELCAGVFIVVTDREALRPVRMAAEIAAALFRLHGSDFDIQQTWKLFGSREQLEALRAGADPAMIASGWRSDEARWRVRRAPYLLYGGSPTSGP